MDEQEEHLTDSRPEGGRPPQKSRIIKGPRTPVRKTTDSFFYDRLIPLIFLALGLVIVILVVLALGILLGFIPWR